jgi:hypothetical protein
MLNIICAQISHVKEEQYAALIVINFTIMMMVLTVMSSLPFTIWLLFLLPFWFFIAFMLESLVTIIKNYE